VGTALNRSALGASLLASCLYLCPGSAGAAFPVIFDGIRFTDPRAAVNNNVAETSATGLFNCLAAEGCLGRDGNVDVAGGNPPGFPNVSLPSFIFPLPPDVFVKIFEEPGTIGFLRVTASRDIGHREGEALNDFVTVKSQGINLGNLFQFVVDTCPLGERGVNYAADLVCGPNFHTDVAATDGLDIFQSQMRDLSTSGFMSFQLIASPDVGRLKIFSVELTIQAVPAPPVPEPSTYALLALGLGLVSVAVRARK
jgi:hypothetical protein